MATTAPPPLSSSSSEISTRSSTPQTRPAFTHASTSYATRLTPSPAPSDTPYREPSTIPFLDCPPSEKTEPLLPSDGSVRPHHVPYLPQNAPQRGLYGQRRIPSTREEVVSAARSRSASWRSRLCGPEGGLGRALILGWVVTTGLFLLATAFWRGQLFSALDQLSKVLEAMGLEGKLVFGYLILLTTIPPLPLYSTLIVLAGYTFGVWEGFAVSYIASLVGAVLVFLVSRTLLRDVMTRCLSSSPTSMSLLQIIPANPHLLLLIRVAPYPYNLLNVILASAPSLTLRTYTGCTALSLIKLLIHTWIGAGIHDLSETYTPEWREAHWHMGPDEFGGEWRPPHMHRPYGEQWTGEEKHRHDVKIWSTWVGIGLCVALFFYLTRLAKKALARAQLEQEREVEERGVEVGDVAR